MNPDSCVNQIPAQGFAKIQTHGLWFIKIQMSPVLVVYPHIKS